jgi:hypothetical protein
LQVWWRKKQHLTYSLRCAAVAAWPTTDFDAEYALMQKLIGEGKPYVFSHEESIASGE